MLNFVGTIFEKIARRIALRRRLSGFVCQDCERWQCCGLPPSDKCPIRVEQMSREEGRLPHRVNALVPW
jgi:hypothetical protein